METLVDRDRELSAIAQRLVAARAGAGSAVVVEGPSGIGKTALLHGARRLADGMRILEGGGSELEREYPLGVARQCLEPAVRRRQDAARLLQGPAKLAENPLLGVPEPDEGTPVGLLHGLFWLVANLAEMSPLLLVVDDAHCADEPSLRFLVYLARRLESVAAVLLVGARTEGQGPELEELRSLALRLEPAALDVSGVERFLAGEGASVDAAFARACHDATGGNPFLLGELMRAAPGPDAAVEQVREIAPPNVARNVAATLRRLGPGADALARAVAVLGDGVALELAAALAGLPIADASVTAAGLAGAGLFAGSPDLRFRHPILGSSVRATMAGHELALAHARAAALLRDRGASPERIALQLLHAPPQDDPDVVAELRAAAAVALQRGAAETAVRLLERALAEPPAATERSPLLLELGDAESRAGRPAAAAERLAQAHRLATDPITRGRAAFLLAQSQHAGRAEQETVFGLVQQAADEVAPLDGALALRLSSILVVGGRIPPPDLPGETVEEALVLAASIFPRLRVGARADEIAAVAALAARHADALSHEGAGALAFTAMVLGLRWADRLDEAERVLDRGIAVARRRGSVTDFAMAMTLRAGVRRRAGRLRDAEADARTARDAVLEPEWTFARGVAPLAATLLDMGRAEEAERDLAAVFADNPLPDLPPMLPVLLARMAVRAARRDHAGALADWEEARARVERGGGINAGWIEDLAVVADVYAAVGDQEGRDEAIRLAGELADAWGTPGARGQALQMRARAERDIEGVREAVELLAASPARLLEARARVELGAALRRRGHRVESRIPLRDGYELALACGADGLAEHARGELRASGIRLRRPASTGPMSLTPSERRIADLAAAGLSNPEIAQELFLTVKTIEMHLTSAYRKLGVSGRRDLAAALPDT